MQETQTYKPDIPLEVRALSVLEQTLTLVSVSQEGKSRHSEVGPSFLISLKRLV